MVPRERTEQNERLMLSPKAAFVSESRGREKDEPKCEFRTDFQRDRDRVLHCKAFRRLKHKTQVFLSPKGDHYRTRMTHTLEVSQIARTIARALQLNEDLTEAIALAHDLGHTPFGHAGERALNKCIEGGFRHYEQSVRVVDCLENNGQGLNLTWEVRNGVLCHTKGAQADTLEGRIVRLADHVAYINHDIDDACRAGIFTSTDIPKALTDVLGTTQSQRINTMVTALVNGSQGVNDIRMTPEVGQATDELRTYMFKNLYHNPIAKAEEEKAKEMLEQLFYHFVQHPEEMPELYFKNIESETVERCVCDYVSGMTDRYAMERFREIYMPRSWRTGKENRR